MYIPKSAIYLLALIGIVFISFKMGQNSKPKDPNAIDYKAKYENIRKQFESINQVDFEEYLKLQNEKEKYEKADEILGKILKIFLADLGLRVESNKIAKVKNNLQNSAHCEEYFKDASPPTATVTIVSANKVANENKAETPIAEWQKNEFQLKQAISDREIKDKLKAVEIDDLFSEIGKATTLKPKQLRTLNGEFEGQIVFDDKNKKPWEVLMGLRARLNAKKQLQGDAIIKLSQNGKAFSTYRSSSGIDHFYAFGGNSEALLIGAYSNDGFFQLYPQFGGNRFVGNYYAKDGISKFKKVGIVILEKRGRYEAEVNR